MNQDRFFIDHLVIYDDSTCDAKISVDGNFKDANEKHVYLEELCLKLNQTLRNTDKGVDDE